MPLPDNEENMEIDTVASASSAVAPPGTGTADTSLCSSPKKWCEGETMITDTMIKEEEQLKAEKNEEEMEEERRNVAELSNMKESKRYERLQHLLNKSNIYSKILLNKMEAQLEENKKEKERKRKAIEEGIEKKRESRRNSRKRKLNEETKYQISDYLDESGSLKKRQKIHSKEDVTSTTSNERDKKKSGCRFYEGELIPATQPTLVTGGILRPYQLEGVEWLNVLYENGVNGILADEMGLGKTIQCIGFIAYLIEMGVKGPFLVVAPLSTICNWVSEFKKFTPSVTVYLYHGSISERLALRRKIFRSKHKDDVLPVVVTSYEICLKDNIYLANKSWKFLIVDEGHRIKNLNCKLIRTLKTYNAANRLLLTGTPLQNNLAELWSLLNFLIPDLFDDLNSFQSWFDFSSVVDDTSSETNQHIIAREKEEKVLSTLHQILTPFLLRRLKSDVELNIPPKKEILVYAPLTALQEKYYTLILNKTIDKLISQRKGEQGPEEIVSEVLQDSNSKRYSKRQVKERVSLLTDEQFEDILSGQEFISIPSACKENIKSDQCSKSIFNVKMTCVWVMLRKCCNHPYLIEFPLTEDGNPKIDRDIITSSGKLLMLDRMLPLLLQQNHKVLIFSQMTQLLDILCDFLEMSSFNYSRLDGSMSYADRESEMKQFRDDPDCNVFLLSTRAGGLGINLTAADTVIIFDSDWNPQADLQAQDRCHRIGQTRPVMVYRFVTANSIDQRIVERAAAKRRLEKMIIHKGKFKGGEGRDSHSTLSVEDLTELLESVDHDKVVNSEDIISDAALTALLDRSMLSNERDDSGAPSVDHDNVFKVVIEETNHIDF